MGVRDRYSWYRILGGELPAQRVGTDQYRVNQLCGCLPEVW